MSSIRQQHQRRRLTEPESEEVLIARGTDFIIILGADQRMKCVDINNLLDTSTKINSPNSFHWISVIFRGWLTKYHEDTSINEAPDVTDEELISYLQDKCGAKNFGHWFARLKARSNFAATTQTFYEDNDESGRNSRRHSKVRRRNKNKNNNSNNNNNNGNDSANSEDYNIDALDQDQLPEEDDSDSQMNAFDRINKRKNKRIARKIYSNMQDDLVSFILVSGYNKAGLSSDDYLNRMKGFYRNNNLKISDIKSVDQLDKYNSDLPAFLLVQYFKYLFGLCKNDDERLKVAEARKDVAEIWLLNYKLKIIPSAVSNQVIKLININTKADEFVEKFTEYMDEAFKEIKFRIGWNYVAKDLICYDKALSGICDNIKECNLLHNVCGRCGYAHVTGMCKRLKKGSQRLILANHKFNFDQFRRAKFNSGGSGRKPWQKGPGYGRKPWQRGNDNNPNGQQQGKWQWVQGNQANPPSNPPNNPPIIPPNQSSNHNNNS